MRAAALDDRVIDRNARCQPATTVEDDAGAEVGLETLLEIIVERSLRGGNDDEITAFALFVDQSAPPRCCSPADNNNQMSALTSKIRVAAFTGS
jgi:hypothetical protein